ncbi:40S ribosomal protein S27-like [Chytriomyces hyalinus]|nr:40S ribosomal protein S27-like [Chytriomyces hyalinus]
MTLAIDLLNPLESSEKRSHKLKRLVQSPNSFFMDVKCPGCFQITTVFSHAQTVVQCSGCATILSQPTGGKARLTGEEPSALNLFRTPKWHALKHVFFFMLRRGMLLQKKAKLSSSAENLEFLFFISAFYIRVMDDRGNIMM